jgi:hypothetical protein
MLKAPRGALCYHIVMTDYTDLEKLEESLWIADTRFDYEYMDNLMADDFFEFGRSGRIYSKAESLSAKRQEIRSKIPLKNFKVHEINENVVLVTYVSEVDYGEIEIGNRSSLWLKTKDGWKLKFHQGTPTNK